LETKPQDKDDKSATRGKTSRPKAPFAKLSYAIKQGKDQVSSGQGELQSKVISSSRHNEMQA